MPLGAVEPQGRGEAGQRGRRHRDVPRLLDPGVPRRTEAGELRNFLAPQAGRAPSPRGDQPDRGGCHPLALSPDEIAKLAPALQ